MQRIGAAEYTILGTVKGAELELLRLPIRLWALTCRRSSTITSPRTPKYRRGTLLRPGAGG